MNIQQVCDVVEIQSLLSAYVYAIDAKNYDALDSVFTSDCVFEYIIENGRSVKGDYPRIKSWLAKTLADFPMTEHLIGLPRINVGDNVATASSMLFNPMQLGANHGDQLFFVGGVYHDKLIRTAQGWRISERKEQGSWIVNPPKGWTAPQIEQD